MLEYLRGLLFRSDHNYPDDVIIHVVDYKLGHSALQPYAGSVWERAVEAATKFGAHLQR